MWHRGKITRVDYEKRTAVLHRIGGAWGDGNMTFVWPKDHEPFVIRAFDSGEQIDIYVTGHRAELYNMIVDGLVTRISKR